MGVLSNIDVNIENSDIFVLKHKIFTKALTDAITNTYPLGQGGALLPATYKAALYIKGKAALKELTMYDLYKHFELTQKEILQFCNSYEIIRDDKTCYDSVINIGHAFDPKRLNRKNAFGGILAADLIYICLSDSSTDALNYLETGHMPMKIYYNNGGFETDLYDIVNGTCHKFNSLHELVGKNFILNLHSVEKIKATVEKSILCHHIMLKDEVFKEFDEFIENTVK
jgi:hypothetical protein